MADFPGRLMTLLEDENVQNCMHWLPSGLAFEISNPQQFIDAVLKTHFNSVRFESFVVRLGKWGFKRLGKKVDKRYLTYTFASPLFRKDKPHLCHSMTILKKAKPRDEKVLCHMFDVSKEQTTIPTICYKQALPIIDQMQKSLWENTSLPSLPYQRQLALFPSRQYIPHLTYHQLQWENSHDRETSNSHHHQKTWVELQSEKNRETVAAVALMNLASHESSWK